MRRARWRLTAAVMLAGWLIPLALPVLCASAPRSEDAGCEEPMPPARGAPVLAGMSQQLPCANSALCSVPVTAVPTPLTALLGWTPGEVAAFFHVSPLYSGAPRAPLPPPPQA